MMTIFLPSCHLYSFTADNNKMKLLLILLIIIAGGYDDPALISKLEKQVADNPDAWQSCLELAEIFIEQENFKEAKKYLLQAQESYKTGKIDTCSARYFYIWGLYNDYNVNIPVAINYYSKTIECDSTFSEAWRNKGYLYEIFGNYDLMLNCFKHALLSTDDSAGVYYDIGVTYDYMDSIELALESYYHAIKLGEDSPQAFLNIGVDWGLTGYVDSAAFYFEKAEQAGLNSPELFYNIGVIMSESGAYNEAMDNFMKTLAVDPDYSPAKLQLGNIYEIMADSGMAKVYFEEFVQTAPPIYIDDVKKIEAKLVKYNKTPK